MSARELRLILGDQLNPAHSWYRKVDADVVYLIAELPQETAYVRHHIQKLCAFFAAMGHFARALEDAGHRVHYLTLDDSVAFKDLPALIAAQVDALGARCFSYQQPDEYRLCEQLRALDLPDVEVRCVDSEHFLIPHADIGRFARAGERKQMEAFYRRLRKRFDILMDGDQPEGGQWNYDADNRNKLNAEALEAVPEPLVFGNDVSDVLARLRRHKVDSLGEPEASLRWPVTRSQARELLDFFCQHCLPNFGRYQDAMTGQSAHAWSLYHSRLSFALNSKMLQPLQVIRAAIAHWRKHPDVIDIAQVEGFVRQILGWREFVRVIYWANMPDYGTLNFLRANRPLPKWYWTGKTRMACLHHAIDQSLQTAYAHHIQRLMVTGNFALLAGIDPDELDQWYLGIYVDALEWVELPNTRGMSQYADGGIVGSKPYAAGGSYMNRMSDYCGQCHYKVADKTGERACPLNSLYWHFLDRHKDQLQNNRRLSLSYANWARMADQQVDILAHAETLLDHIDDL